MQELWTKLNNPLVLVRLLEGPIFVASILLLVWASTPWANPLRVALRPVWRVFTRRNYFVYVSIGMSVILFDVLLTARDHSFTEAVLASRGEDFTSFIWHWEENRVAIFQRWMWMPLTWYLTWAYVIVFPALVPWGMAVLDWLGQKRRLVSLLIAFIMNYVLVVPFYIFFPVQECHIWFKNLAGDGHRMVTLRLDNIHPAIMTVLRPMSGADNCFPSFHTSLAVTLALFALASGRKRFAIAMNLMSLSIVFSTLYLGIHWLTDVAGGILVGVVAFLVGEWLGKRLCRGRLGMTEITQEST
jgi:membrane-associated phospholipid phosphatase